MFITPRAASNFPQSGYKGYSSFVKLTLKCLKKCILKNNYKMQIKCL